jgi:lantibiotic modifying enzyme
MIPAEVLAHLATRASTLEERLAPPFVTAADRGDRIEACITRWADLGAKGDRERLQRSLHWRGIDLDRIRAAFGGVTLPPDAALPAWVLRFAVLLEAALNEQRHENAGPPPDNERAAVMMCFGRAAAAELRRTIPAHARAGVADSALAAMEQSLLLRLTRIAGPVLTREYYLYSYSDSRRGGNPESRAQRFAERMLRPTVPEFITEYPVLARLLTLACDNWQAAALELLGRLAADRGAIIEQFDAGCDLGPLVDIQVGDADVHDGHREVVILVFGDGFRIVYKPRSLALDQAFHGLVHWFNQRGLSPSLSSPAVLCRDGYGWAEFIAYRPANGAGELGLFYERAGVLACVAYVMGATDLHYGNVIAHGGYPMVVDLETFLMAEPRSGALPVHPAGIPIPHLGQGRSVLHSLLLPLTHRVPTGAFTDISPLSAEPQGEIAKQGRNWLPVRETPMALVLRDYASVIEAGFVSAYRFIERQREALLSECGPLAAFERCPIRIVLRDTALYFQLLRQSIDPAVLRDGIDRRIALERLNHVIALADTPPSFVEMVTREQSALSGLDVPRFLVMTGETDLRDAAGLVAAKVMERTPLEEMRLRVEAMSEPDLQRQCKDIRWSLSSHISGRPGSRCRDLSSATPTELPDAAMLIAAAERLGADLLDEADSPGNPPPPWRGLIFLSAASRFTVGDAGASFADGGLGIAAFFAALFRVTGNPKWRQAALDLSLRYLTPVANSTAYRGHLAGGIAAGLGGLLHGAALIGALIESEEVLGNGLTLARGLAGRTVDEEKNLSLGDGLAGTLLGVASLRRLIPDAGLDVIAERGAARLRSAKPLVATGLLSGQAGLVLAANAIGLEGDFSVQDELLSEGPIDWAEGALGLSLAALQTGSRAGDALSFLDSLASAPRAADDSFAFGTAGEVDALIWAADRAGRPALRRLALQRITETAKRAYRGTPRLLGGMLGEGLRIPGLLHGSAGIGYTMLRLASPDRLPALAVFELPLEQKVA